MVIKINKQVKDVYIVIGDPKKFVKILNYLEKYGVIVRGVDIDTKNIQGIILVDNEGLKYLNINGVEVHGYVINVDDYGVEKSLALTIVLAKTSIARPLVRVVIGIDYGESVGIAVVVNNDIIYTHSHRCKENILSDIKFFIENIDAQIKIIRIGSTPSLDHVFVDLLVNMFKDIAIIELVPERNSSRFKHYIEQKKLKPDEVAAINIALHRSMKDNN